MHPEGLKYNDASILCLARMAKALGHPARIAVLKTIAERSCCCCGDLTDSLPLAQSTISQHLKELKSAGLINGKADGVRTVYYLNANGIEKLKSLFSELFSELSFDSADPKFPQVSSKKSRKLIIDSN